LSSTADLKSISPQWKFGGRPECATRITRIPGFENCYGAVFKSFKSLDAGVDRDEPTFVASQFVPTRGLG
jgi:hypothetical protein